MQKLLSYLSTELLAKELKIATAESCTGGWIGKVLTDQAGSSGWFAGGLICYSNQAKQDLLSVPKQLLKQHGAVSEAVAQAMASGAQQHFKNCLSVAVTGIAGPGGGSDEKPVGTVCIAVCLQEGIESRTFHFDGNRESVRLQTVEQALEMALTCLAP